MALDTLCACSTLTACKQLYLASQPRLFGTAEEAWRCESYCRYFLSWSRHCPVLAQESTPAIIVQNDGKAGAFRARRVECRGADRRLFGRNHRHDDLRQSPGAGHGRRSLFPAARRRHRQRLRPRYSRARWSTAWSWKSNGPRPCSRPKRPAASTRDWSNGPSATTSARASFPFRPAAGGSCACSTSASWSTGPAARTYRLPLGFTRPIPAFSLRVEVVKPAAEPKVRQSAAGELPVHPVARQLRGRDETGKRPARQGTDRCPARRGKAERAGREGRRRAGLFRHPRSSARRCRGPVAVPAETRGDLLGRLGLAGDGDHQREIAAAEGPAGRMDRCRSRPLQVDLVLLRNALSPPRRFDLTAKDCRRVDGRVEATDYDGGTQLGRWRRCRRDARLFALVQRRRFHVRPLRARAAGGAALRLLGQADPRLGRARNTWPAATAASASTWRKSATRRSSRPSRGRPTGRLRPRRRPARSRGLLPSTAGSAAGRFYPRGTAGIAAGRRHAPLPCGRAGCACNGHLRSTAAGRPAARSCGGFGPSRSWMISWSTKSATRRRSSPWARSTAWSRRLPRSWCWRLCSSTCSTGSSRPSRCRR